MNQTKHFSFQSGRAYFLGTLLDLENFSMNKINFFQIIENDGSSLLHSAHWLHVMIMKDHGQDHGLSYYGY